MDLVKTAKKYLDQRAAPLLLGYSGGPDSKALLYALLEAGAKELHVAHVDHGWREESGAECARLKEEVETLGLPFHSIRLSGSSGKNLEEEGREARFSYFRELFQKIPFGALFLAHHADDRAETVLKRIFEGAHLPFLGGMREESTLFGMPICRPFLSFSKKEIEAFLEERKLSFIVDRTNDDPRFLRGRMRTELIPTLTEVFGKEIRQNLLVLSERAEEWKAYLERKVEPIWAKRVEGAWGVCVPLDGVERLEARYLLQKMVSFSRPLLEAVLDAALERKGNLHFSTAKEAVWVDRGWVFVLESRSASLPNAQFLRGILRENR